MAGAVCLHYERSGALSALPVIDRADCPGLVVQAVAEPLAASPAAEDLASPSALLCLVLIGACLALSIVRGRFAP